MKNLLPDYEQKNLRQHYRVRLATVALGLLVMVEIIAALALFPSFILVFSKKELLAQELAVLNERIKLEEGDMMRAYLLESRQNIARAHSFYAQKKPSDILRVAVTGAPSGIVLDEFAVTVEQGAQPRLVLQGLATTRGILIAYRDAVRASEGVTGVELPFRDLASNQNIPFTLTVTFATSTTGTMTP